MSTYLCNILIFFLYISIVAETTVPSSKTFKLINTGTVQNPVGEGATLSFGTDRNLVLRQDSGSLAWQTGTANKGVVGIKLLENGNLVLVNNQGRFVWQSFNHPTDTILIGQGLYLGGVNERYGGYSFFMEKNQSALYLNSKTSRKPILYNTYNLQYPIGKAQENLDKE